MEVILLDGDEVAYKVTPNEAERIALSAMADEPGNNTAEVIADILADNISID